MGDDVTEPISLLVIDFDGVCTVSGAEQRERAGAGGDVGDLASTVRIEAEAVVDRARELGVTTLVLSNEISYDWVDRVPLLAAVDHVVACGDNRIFKPDRRAFQRCLLLTGAEAAATLVVDDGPDNITVAASLGMQTTLFDLEDPAGSWGEVVARLEASGPA